MTVEEFLAEHRGKPTEAKSKLIVQLAASQWNAFCIGACPRWPSLATALKVLNDKKYGPLSRGFDMRDRLKHAEASCKSLNWNVAEIRRL